MTDPSSRLERRHVLRAGAVAFATIALGGCASLFTKKAEPDVTVTASGGDVRVPVARAPWVRGGPGTLVVAVAGRDDKILLFRDPEGALAAVSMTCTHRGCDVGYDAAKGRIVCPCHGSEFYTAGGVRRGPATMPLDAYPVRIDGEDIVVRIG